MKERATLGTWSSISQGRVHVDDIKPPALTQAIRYSTEAITCRCVVPKQGVNRPCQTHSNYGESNRHTHVPTGPVSHSGQLVTLQKHLALDR